jgi:hypothetical protein
MGFRTRRERLRSAVQRADRHLDNAFGRRPGRHAPSIKRRQRARDVQGQFAAGIFGRGTRDSENLGFAPGAQFSGKIGLRLDKDAGPSRLLQQPGLRAFVWIVGADLPKKAATNRIS